MLVSKGFILFTTYAHHYNASAANWFFVDILEIT